MKELDDPKLKSLLDKGCEEERRRAETRPGEDTAFNIAAIQVRAETVTSTMEEILRTHVSSHWGINE
jgi:hypothetical protein